MTSITEIFLPCTDEEGQQLTTSSIHHPNHVMINPANQQTYDFMTSLITEVAEQFPDQYVHLGYDGDTDECWWVPP